MIVLGGRCRASAVQRAQRAGSACSKVFGRSANTALRHRYETLARDTAARSPSAAQTAVGQEDGLRQVRCRRTDHLQAPVGIAQEPNAKILVVDMIGNKQLHPQPVTLYIVRELVGYEPVLHFYLQSNQTQPQSAAPTRYKSQVSDTA